MAQAYQALIKRIALEVAGGMFPVFDIPLPSPSLKRTQREANFLSGKITLQSRSVPEDRRQHIVVEVVGKTGRWSWQALLLFDEERKPLPEKNFRLFVGAVDHVDGPSSLRSGVYRLR
ncbi:hypothetical protein N7468_006747 [Penicillium chermesinum]|uniref:Uncharacterized protein n=1 Tax=Penicillium chermesinum TaxID=63820 RepID=A0A9W9NST1_9EURO|nr:uncharacterized protein N7468_006747 [Penicillium chermesinum]KAJ5225522.1 hypothetical protein N7468_006747 [Penicillium chermesinum]